jgi:hypothetical protein
VTNAKIPCTLKEFAEMGSKVKFTVTVLGVSKLGWAYAPYKRAAATKKQVKQVKDPNSRPLFELMKDSEGIKGVQMFSFKKANSNFDRGEHDPTVSACIHIGQVLFVLILLLSW